MNIQSLPAIFSTFNFMSFMLVVSAFIAIKYKKRRIHGMLMVSALASSFLFLVLYLLYHFNISEPKRFQGTGIIRYAYFTILISHTILAVIILPFIGITVYNVIRKSFEKHKRIARITLPLWMYVSVTGIVIYFMLYGL